MGSLDKKLQRCKGCGVWIYDRDLCESCYPKE
jgi:hypothetical protein